MSQLEDLMRRRGVDQVEHRSLSISSSRKPHSATLSSALDREAWDALQEMMRAGLPAALASVTQLCHVVPCCAMLCHCACQGPLHCRSPVAMSGKRFAASGVSRVSRVLLSGVQDADAHPGRRAEARERSGVRRAA